MNDNNNTLFLSDSLKNLIDEKSLYEDNVNNVQEINKNFSKADIVLKINFFDDKSIELNSNNFKKTKNHTNFYANIDTDTTILFLKNKITLIDMHLKSFSEVFDALYNDIYYSIRYIDRNNYLLKIKIKSIKEIL